MSKPLAAIVLFAVLIVDLLLIRYARHDLRQDPVSGSPAVAAVEIPATIDAASSVLLGLAEDGTVAYADRGSCANGESRPLTLASTGGGDPREVTPGVTEVLRIQAVDAETIYVEGTTDDCGVVVERISEDGGETWRDTTGDIEFWHVAPGSTTSVVTTERTDPGCTVAALTELPDDAGAVACSDGRVLTTGDGTAWDEAGVLESIRALWLDTPQTGGAVTADAECPSRYAVTGDGGATWQTAGCIPGEGPAAVATRGPEAVAVVGGRLSVTTDGGTTWA